jgi:hypothetical protein
MEHTKRRAAHLINTLRHRQYHELCELLGGWGNPKWRELIFGNGEPRVASPDPWLFVDGEPVVEDLYDYSLVRRTHYDLDWHNYVLTQVWDHWADEPTWEFILLHNTGENDWVPEQVWSWGDRCPSEGEAGSVVDEIEFLRYN